MSIPKVSVIVPVYKVEQYLCECIDSILRQTFTNLEVLLIDDGSPDRCGHICNEYAEKDNRVRVFHKKNGGVSSARNFGLDHARGEWIAFVDSDDWLNKNDLTVFFDPIPTEVSMIQIGYTIESKHTKKKIYSPEINELISIESFLFRNCFTSAVFSYFIRKSVIDNGKIRFQVGRKYGEDGEFMMTCLLYSTQIYRKVQHEYFYRYNQTSATKIFSSYSDCKDALKNAETVFKAEVICSNEKVTCRLKNYYVDRLRRFIIRLAKHHPVDLNYNIVVCDFDNTLKLLKRIDFSVCDRILFFCFRNFPRLFLNVLRLLMCCIRHY